MTGADPLVALVLLLAGASSVWLLGVWLLIEARRRRRERLLLELLAAFGPAVAAARADPQRFVAWSEVARTARALFPRAFAQLDAASGGRFPFSRAAVEAAHARWTADWLAWERRHDLEYKERAAAAESALAQAGGEQAEALRARLAAVNQEKLRTYQERYEQYVRVGKAIAALEESPAEPPGGAARQRR